jgi:hypothetical protein
MRVLVVVRPCAGGEHDPLIDVDGELAVLPVPERPDGDLHLDAPDGFVGVDSLDPTAIVMVSEMDVSPHVVMEYVRESLARHRPWSAAALRDMAARLAAEMFAIAQHFPAGSVLTVDGPSLTAHIPVCAAPDLHLAGLAHGGRRPVCDPRDRSRRGP